MSGVDFLFFGGKRRGNGDVNFSARVDGVELDLFDAAFRGGGVGGFFFFEFGAAGADAVVGLGDVVVEDGAGVVAWGCDTGGETMSVGGFFIYAVVIGIAMGEQVRTRNEV